MLALWIKSIEKTLIKITILVAIFSAFLEISYKTILNYFIFLGIVYFMGLLYILFKMSYKIEIYDTHINIKNFFRSYKIPYKNFSDFFITSGYLQKKFNLYSIYIITRRKNFLIKDIPQAEKIYNKIKDELELNHITPENWLENSNN